MQMKLTAVALTAAFALEACANGASLSTNIATAEQDVQAATLAICSVVPTASSIASLILLADPLLATANAIAAVICKTVQSMPAAAATPVSGRRAGVLYGVSRPAPINVDGIVIRFQ